MSVLSQFMALATDALYKCSTFTDTYKNLVNSVNHQTSLSYGSKVSEDVANFVSTSPISDKMGEANGHLDFLIKNCDVSEGMMKIIADYNQNIYDSLDIYKHTTPHAIPEFGELSIIMVGLSFVGIVAIQKRHEIVGMLKKVQNRLRNRKFV